MDWQALIFALVSTALTTLLAFATKKVIALIDAKIADDRCAKLLKEAWDTVTGVVKITYQTYVEALKGQDAFTEEAQKIALEKAVNMAKERLSAEVQEYIEENFGDVEVWIKDSIEEALYDLKK